MADDKPDSAVEVARINSRTQIAIALVGLASGVVLALIGQGIFAPEPAPPPPVPDQGDPDCAIAAIRGTFGQDGSAQMIMDVAAGSFEGWNDSHRMSGKLHSTCVDGAVYLRLEGNQSGSGAPVYCLFEGEVAGRTVGGRHLCSDAAAEMRWRGDITFEGDGG